MLVRKQEVMAEVRLHLMMDVKVVIVTVELVVVMILVMVMVKAVCVVVVMKSMFTLLAATPGVAVSLRFVDLDGGMSVTW